MSAIEWSLMATRPCLRIRLAKVPLSALPQDLIALGGIGVILALGVVVVVCEGAIEAMVNGRQHCSLT